jgi:hypothetical protein
MNSEDPSSKGTGSPPAKCKPKGTRTTGVLAFWDEKGSFIISEVLQFPLYNHES